MSLKVNWNDKRVSVIAGSQSIYLSTKDQKRIWSPHLVIASSKISLKKEEEEFSLEKKPDSKYDGLISLDNGAIASTYVLFNTLIKCEMDFETFPFDQHASLRYVYNEFKNILNSLKSSLFFET